MKHFLLSLVLAGVTYAEDHYYEQVGQPGSEERDGHGNFGTEDSVYLLFSFPIVIIILNLIICCYRSDHDTSEDDLEEEENQA